MQSKDESVCLMGNSMQPLNRQISSLAVCNETCCREHALHFSDDCMERLAEQNLAANSAIGCGSGH